MHYRKLVIVAFAGSLLLTACGGGPNGGNAFGNKTVNQGITTTINSYSVTGTSAATPGGPEPIEAGVNGGDFDVSWDVTSSDPYHVDLYVSSDALLSKTTDIKFLSQNCGSNSAFYNCTQTANFTCNFATDNKISCTTGTSATNPVDLTSFLTGSTSPMDAYLIIEACDNQLTDCKNSSIAVQFSY